MTVDPQFPVPTAARFPESIPASVSTHFLQGSWVSLILDQIDYGVVVVASEGRLVYANEVARRALRDRHPLQVDDQHLSACRADDVVRLRKALGAAARHGMRTLLTFGDDGARTGVAVVPIPPPAAGESGAALLVIGKQAVCEELSVQWYGRLHGLTSTESHVLGLLCDGAMPGEIAHVQGVAMSTIRSQISSIRAKTGARNIGALVRQVAVLPPLVNTLRTRPQPLAA